MTPKTSVPVPKNMKKSGSEIPGFAFSRLLLKWNRDQNRREMPWKGEKDPYKIWLSEIILQQTRVEQGWKYYNDFVRNFPTIHDLARASDEKVLKCWEGLGYYSRCRNLLATARYISSELGGQFPDQYEDILSLKGVGPYTAAAISSFAYNLPHAVVDGNVFRVLARVYGISKPSDSTDGKKYFTALAQQILDQDQPGLYNQAIMDFGATICKPLAPLCTSCVFKKYCKAYQEDNITAYPVKEKKVRVTKRNFYFLVLEYKQQIAIRQRMEKDIWQGLFEFPLLESAATIPDKALVTQAASNQWLHTDSALIQSVSPWYKQQLTHQVISGKFVRISLKKKPAVPGFIWLTKKELKRYAFPRLFREYLEAL